MTGIPSTSIRIAKPRGRTGRGAARSGTRPLAFARRVCVAALLVAGASLGASAQTWAPNETQVSPQADLIDAEFSQSRAMITWSDEIGRLWIAYVDPETGDVSPSDGHGILVDPDVMRFQDAQKTKNGPEWVSTSLGDHIVYTKYAGRHTDGNSRIGYAYPDANGVWQGGYLDANLVRKAPYGSLTDGDPAPRITYVDHRENHYWRDLWDPSSEQLIPDFPASNYPIYHVRGARAVLYPLAVDGTDQVFYRDLDSGVVEQLTSDPGQKYQMFMWPAPEFGGEMVFMTLVDEVELRLYRKLPDPVTGVMTWTPIVRHLTTGGAKLYSPEPFVYDGKSYAFMSASNRGAKFRSEIWIANFDAAAPIFRRITPTDELRTRTDPEVFITAKGPMIYFNRLVPDSSSTGRPKTCREIRCSEGMWRADPGLGPTTAVAGDTTTTRRKRAIDAKSN